MCVKTRRAHPCVSSVFDRNFNGNDFSLNLIHHRGPADAHGKDICNFPDSMFYPCSMVRRYHGAAYFTATSTVLASTSQERAALAVSVPSARACSACPIRLQKGGHSAFKCKQGDMAPFVFPKQSAMSPFTLLSVNKEIWPPLSSPNKALCPPLFPNSCSPVFLADCGNLTEFSWRFNSVLIAER
jgi:hypothetical protein